MSEWAKRKGKTKLRRSQLYGAEEKFDKQKEMVYK